MEALDTDGFIEIIKDDLEERRKARNIHITNIEIATQVENELQTSTIIPIIIDVANKEADEALSELATTEPSNTNKIITLQGKIYRAKMLSDTLIAIRQRGLSSQLAIQDDVEDINGQEISEDR